MTFPARLTQKELQAPLVEFSTEPVVTISPDGIQFDADSP